MTSAKRKRLTCSAAAVFFGLLMTGPYLQQVQAESAPAAASTSETAIVSLKNLKNAASRVMKATVDVISDVGQRKVAPEIGDPRLIQPSDKQIEENPQLWAKELAALGPLEAPRKSWLDSDMATLKRWIDVLNADIASPPSSGDAALLAKWGEMSDVVKSLNKHFAALEGLAAGPNYDNLAIAQAAFAIRDDVSTLEKQWKDAVKTTGKGH